MPTNFKIPGIRLPQKTTRRLYHTRTGHLPPPGRHQLGSPDPVTRKPAPIRFIFIKATEGGDLLDTRFHTNFTQAKQKGFTCGAYHFYNPQTSPGRQAAFFIQNVTLSTGDLPPVLDIEKRGNKPLSTFQHEILTWLQKVEKHYQTKPIIYTSYRFKESYLNDSIFNTYPFWIAHYYVEQVSYPHQWHFWQHTDNATIPGVQSLVDLNVFNGTESQFQEMTIQKERPTT